MQDDTPADQAGASPERSLAADLRGRIVSGLVLAVAALTLAYAGPKPFAVLVLAVALLMSWEWGRLVRGSELDICHGVHAGTILAAVALAAVGYAALGAAALVVGAIIVFSLRFGEHALLSAAGIVYTGLPAIALLWLREDEPWGFLAVLFVFAVVAATDTAAYIAGRLVGGPRLAPAISPNKTWSGLVAGVAAGAAAGAIMAYVAGAPVVLLTASGAVLAVLAQAGDLAESALKRRFGIKDVSNLVPGHGGFMDRMDGIVVVAVAAALLALVQDAAAPARALLFGA